MATTPAIGIDLGTTFSCVGVIQGGRVEIIANDQGQRTTPSYVAFTNKERLIGEAAKDQAASNPANTVFDVKRLIGRRFDDEEVQGDMKHWPFQVVNSGGTPMIKVQHCGKTKHFIAEQISSMLLMKMKETAEAYLDQKVTDAVITVPAYFNVNQRQATIDAGKLAGLNVLRLINEPTAAAIAYSLDKHFDSLRNVLIFDWGGGTFDVSILSIENGKFEVKAVGGDTHLGGEDITSRLVDHFVENFKQEHEGKDLTTSKKAISQSLFEGIDFSANLSRARFEQLCFDLFSRTMDAVKTTLSDAMLHQADIHEVVLVGGSTRIPKVRKLLQDFFNGREAKRSTNADEAVAYGATLLASNLTGERSEAMKDLVLLEVTPLSLGTGVRDDMVSTVVKRNTQIPTEQTKYFTTNSDNQQHVWVQVFEGERPRTSDNNLLGKFILSGISPAPRGVPQIGVTFSINENGILHVSAVDKSSGNANSIKITNYKGRLSEDDIERMLKDAEKFRLEDEKERSRMAAKNDLMDYVYSTKSALEKKEMKQKTLEEHRRNALAMCEEVIKWMDTKKQATKEDYEQMRTKVESECSLVIALNNLFS
ncbi:unnamed protein product [Taenia asiatica]|uniref:Heat shock protein 70 n=1 Tax=Taenia asiatica TaxID=60517 RepID=A0A0R3WDA8_TAEAS|nr:unnamed protein product [Taenia asiatica]